MNANIDFYMEPVRFFKEPSYLVGTDDKNSTYEVITDKDKALQLLFSQDVSSEYMIWDDFFSSLISEFILDAEYKSAQEKIINIIRSESDDVKDAIRKRKQFLIKKKSGLVNDEYEKFLSEINDECHHMLMMISVHRCLRGFESSSKLEEIFSIFKSGAFPCGVKKNQELVVFYPSILKSDS